MIEEKGFNPKGDNLDMNTLSCSSLLTTRERQDDNLQSILLTVQSILLTIHGLSGFVFKSMVYLRMRKLDKRVFLMNVQIHVTR